MSGCQATEIQPSLPLAPGEVWKLSVKQGDESWTIFGGLWSVTRPETNVPYPHHQFRWNWEGKLCEVQVHVSGTAWVQYSLMGNPRRYFSQHAGQDVIDMAPLSLNGLTELFGVSIPWQLDIQAKIQELLEAAELEQFLFHLAQS